MNVAVSEAKGQLTELVRLAESGEDIVLTRHGQPVARISRIEPARSAEDRRALLKQIQAEASAKIAPGPDAARSADFLYDDDGLPA
jgi:prevent-host-death family protein